MTAPRSIAVVKQYRHYRKQRGSDIACQFCNVASDDPQLITETTYFIVMQNIFPYSVWDGQKVLEHIMLIPKEHTDTLSNLSVKARLEYVELVSQYELSGYNIYARTPRSNKKTVAHQHTHLLRLDGKHMRFFAFMLRPYIRIAR